MTSPRLLSYLCLGAAAAVGMSVPVQGAAAQGDGSRADGSDGGERRLISVVVYGEDACPQGEGDDIVVCARRPESERYRLPKSVRREPETVGAQGWGSTVATIDADARQFIPGSCSVIGAYGQSGCTQAMLDQWFAERRRQQQANAGIP